MADAINKGHPYNRFRIALCSVYSKMRHKAAPIKGINNKPHHFMITTKIIAKKTVQGKLF